MGFLILLARKQHLQATADNISFNLLKINQKIDDLTTYASILSKETIDISDLASLPTSLFAQGIYDAQSMTSGAFNQANNEMAMAQNAGLFGTQPDQNLIALSHRKMYENALKQMQKTLTIRLNEQEKNLKADKTRLEAQEKAVSTELQAMDQRISQGIQESVSTYGLKA